MWRVRTFIVHLVFLLNQVHPLFCITFLCILYNVCVDLSKHVVHNHSDMEDLIALGNANRTTACTGMNNFSSRSHAILTISFSQVSFNGIPAAMSCVDGRKLVKNKIKDLKEQIFFRDPADVM